MKKKRTGPITFCMFLALYIAMTYFWTLSGTLYSSPLSNFKAIDLLKTVLSLIIVMRIAQLIQVVFNISKQNDYALGLLGLSLPLISTLIKRDTSITILGVLIFSILYFEYFVASRTKLKLNYPILLSIVLAYTADVLAHMHTFPEQTTFETIHFVTTSTLTLTILLQICKTNKLMKLSLTTDRYDLYSLAYFSVAGVLFNFCTDNFASARLSTYDFSSLDLANVLLFVFWLTALVRIIQSVHLAALDYQNTELRGIDLFVLSIFYIFITVYHVLDTENTILYAMTMTLSLAAACYFFYMYKVRIHKENTISIIFDERIQAVNATTFTVIFISNMIMTLTGYSQTLYIIQILFLIFNIYHSHELTIWIKHTLLCENNKDKILFLTPSKRDTLIIASAINYHFGYIYKHCFLTKDNKATRRTIYHLLSASSLFGQFGLANFIMLYDINNAKKVGFLLLKSQHSSNAFYTAIGVFSFVFRFIALVGLQSGVKGILNFIRQAKYLSTITDSNTSNLDISYAVIFKSKRNQGYLGRAIKVLSLTNIRNANLYPRKRTHLSNIMLTARENNTTALQAFKRYGFSEVQRITNPLFDLQTNKGAAIIMKLPLVQGDHAL